MKQAGRQQARNFQAVFKKSNSWLSFVLVREARPATGEQRWQPPAGPAPDGDGHNQGAHVAFADGRAADR